MEIKNWLKNYRKNAQLISIAEATNKKSVAIDKLIEEKCIIDIAIAHLDEEHLMAIDNHYRKGMSYDKIARQFGYCKATVFYRAKEGMKVIEQILNKVYDTIEKK